MNESEQYFLACIFLNQSILNKSSIGERHFYDGGNRRIFRAMATCADKNITIDYISICDIDKEIDKRYVSTLTDKVPSAANWKHYEAKLVTTYQIKEIEALGRRLSELPAETEPSIIIEEAESKLLEIGTNSQSRKITKVVDELQPAMARIEERTKTHGKLPGLLTGLPYLDALTGGLQNDRYIIIGARPSDGKSALAINIACNIGLAQKTSVGIISAESSNNEIVTRMLTSESMVNGMSVMTGLIGNQDIVNMTHTCGKLYEAPIYLYDAPNIAFTELKSICRQMVTVYATKCILIDYVQIIQWDDKRIPFYEQVKNVSLGIKQLARELKIPIIALAQLRRDSEGREPEMADLGDSSQLEKDADALIFIYHPKAQEGEQKNSMLLLKKNRDGAKGAIPVNFRREYVKFFPVERD
jgi:replicative DNA helicase